jgi:hypothetical protein
VLFALENHFKALNFWPCGKWDRLVSPNLQARLAIGDCGEHWRTTSGQVGPWLRFLRGGRPFSHILAHLLLQGWRNCRKWKKIYLPFSGWVGVQ